MDSSVYSRLQAHHPQIRLILLLPGLDHEKLSCRLMTVSLNDTPEYDALSYTWGDSNVKEFILLNGYDFPITTNLKAALWHMRLTTRIRKIWIDALCINQNDIPERNQQVQIMRDIYSNANSVIIWLGESSENSGAAMHILEDWSEGFLDYETFRSSDEPSKAEAALWRPVTDLFQRPYWSRGWVVQEIVLAKQLVIYCGRRYIPWGTLNISLYKLGQCERQNYEPFKGEVYQRIILLKMQRDLWQISGCTTQFAKLLDGQRFREVSDPRDFVYSMVGLARDILPSVIVPNYSDPIQQVYQNTTLNVILNTKRLDILGYVWPHLNTSGFPSWVRDWRKSSSVRPFFRGDTGQNIYQASGNLRVISSVSVNPEILTLRGFHYDNLAQLFEFGGETELGLVLGTWKEMARIAEDPNRPYVGSGDFFNAFWRTLIANQAFELDEERQIDQEMVRAPEKEREIAEVIFGLRDFPKGVEKGRYINPLGARILSNSRNRRMVLSQKGYVGLVPFETEQEDIICVLLGGDMPFILRPKGSYYTLVGECYIHGIMDSEVLEAAQGGLIQLQEFSLQ